MVNLTINGKSVQGGEQMTLLWAAKAAGVEVPTLCHMTGLNCIGSCRVCMVDVEGEGLVAACNTYVREGMVVRTDTPAVVAGRRQNIQAIMDEHRAECAGCVRQDTCALRKLASEFNVLDSDVPAPANASNACAAWPNARRYSIAPCGIPQVPARTRA